MKIKTTYIGTLNGISGIWCGFKPENAQITEERQVLYPEDNYELININTGIKLQSVWLKNNDKPENYIETEIELEVEENDNND